MQKKYWDYMVQIKFCIFYLDLYIEDSYKWEQRINIFGAIASSSSIAAWTIWKQFSYIWAVIIAISHVLSAINIYLPFCKRLKLLVPFTIELKMLFNEVEKNWFEVSSGKLTEEQINYLLNKFKREFTNSENKYLKEEMLIEKERFSRKADEKTNEYFSERF